MYIFNVISWKIHLKKKKKKNDSKHNCRTFFCKFLLNCVTPLWNFMVKNQDPWKFHFFKWPLEFPLALSSIGTLRNSMSSTTPASAPPYCVLGFFWVSLAQWWVSGVSGRPERVDGGGRMLCQKQQFLTETRPSKRSPWY